MCDKAVDNNHQTLKCVPDCSMFQKMCDKADCYKTQEMCDKDVYRCCLPFNCILDSYKTQEMYDRVISEDVFLLLYCPNRYKTQKMSGKAVDDCLVALKFIPDWFVTTKMIKNLLTALYADDEDSSDVIFSCNVVRILSVDLNIINFDDTNDDEDDSETIIYARLLA